MEDRLANVAMETGASVQAQATSNPGLVQEATSFLDSDVYHWLETSRAKQHVIQDLILTTRNLIILRQEAARRRSAV